MILTPPLTANFSFLFFFFLHVRACARERKRKPNPKHYPHEIFRETTEIQTRGRDEASLYKFGWRRSSNC